MRRTGPRTDPLPSTTPLPVPFSAPSRTRTDTVRILSPLQRVRGCSWVFVLHLAVWPVFRYGTTTFARRCPRASEHVLGCSFRVLARKLSHRRDTETAAKTPATAAPRCDDGRVSSSNARSTRETSAEVCALHIFTQAGGEPITRRQVEEQLAQWRTHAAGCRCDGPCDLAASISTSHVWCVVWGWQSSLARTRRLAQR